MLYYTALFFIVALIAAWFGFGGIASEAMSIANILFLAFLILALVSFVLGLRGRSRFR